MPKILQIAAVLTLKTQQCSNASVFSFSVFLGCDVQPSLTEQEPGGAHGRVPPASYQGVSGLAEAAAWRVY